MPVNDQTIGCWMGLAIGDALGQSVKGLKPETIRQFFKQVDSYPDVRPFIGKGVRQYRMQGLYGAPMQMALACAETFVKHKGFDSAAFADVLIRLSAGGPESYLGVYRRPEGCFYRILDTLPQRMVPELAEHATAFGSFLSLGMVTALYYGKPSATYLKTAVQVAQFMSLHVWEMAGTVTAGYVALRFLNEGNRAIESDWVQDASEYCRQVEDHVREQRRETHPADSALSSILSDLAERVDDDTESLERWICERANGFLKEPVHHAAQGQMLTLFPLAVVMMLSRKETSFEEKLSRTLAWGREADKLGTLVGGWAGALYGFDAIAPKLKSSLVNSKELKLRGEGLCKRRGSQGKELFEMEMGLTRKEAEEKARYLAKETKKKPGKKTTPLEELWEEVEQDPLLQLKDDPKKWREFERDKTRKKRDRRKGIKEDSEPL